MSEEALIKRCQQNDMGAYKMIFETYGQSLLRTAQRLLGNRQDAEDAVQTTFLKLFRSINNFKFKAKFSTYIFRILINNCYDTLKKHRVHVENLERANLSVNPEPGLSLDLETAVEKLPRRMKACFILHAIEDFKYREIAQILNMRMGTVKANIFRAKEHLRHHLGNQTKEVYQ
jgi:RNA polymerase sigma-70 factor (ECF subfamily)